MISVHEIDNELTKKVECDWFGEFVKVCDAEDPKKFCIVPRRCTKEDLEKIISMKVYEDDTWIITNPKCGTTLTMEMVWLLINDLNFEEALKTIQDVRVPFIEFEAMTVGTPAAYKSFEKTQILPRPRIIKTHLPAFLLPRELFTVKPKIIYVARNPKDAVVSWYHQHVNLHGWKEPNKDTHTFIKAFINDSMFYSPFGDHVLKFWELRNNSNFLFLHFEDMLRNLKSVVEETSKFLGKTYSSEDIEKLCEHLSFNKMRENKSANKEEIVAEIRKNIGREGEWNFIRKGKVGSHKEELTEGQIELIDEYAKKIEAQSDFKFKFE